jgi:hypothetical protein
MGEFLQSLGDAVEDPDGESAALRRSFRSTTYVRRSIVPTGPSPVIDTA